MIRLCLLALEREELVSVAYREDLIAKRLASMPVNNGSRDCPPRAGVGVERRGNARDLHPRPDPEARQPPPACDSLCPADGGRVGGWAGSVRQHVQWRDAPFLGARVSGNVSGQLLDRFPGSPPLPEVRLVPRILYFQCGCGKDRAPLLGSSDRAGPSGFHDQAIHNRGLTVVNRLVSVTDEDFERECSMTNHPARRRRVLDCGWLDRGILKASSVRRPSRGARSFRIHIENTEFAERAVLQVMADFRGICPSSCPLHVTRRERPRKGASRHCTCCRTEPATRRPRRHLPGIGYRTQAAAAELQDQAADVNRVHSSSFHAHTSAWRTISRIRLFTASTRAVRDEVLP